MKSSFFNQICSLIQTLKRIFPHIYVKKNVFNAISTHPVLHFSYPCETFYLIQDHNHQGFAVLLLSVCTSFWATILRLYYAFCGVLSVIFLCRVPKSAPLYLYTDGTASNNNIATLFKTCKHIFASKHDGWWMGVFLW